MIGLDKKRFINFANKIPEIVAKINENNPKMNIEIVSNFKNTFAGIVAPTDSPNKIITIFIKSFCAVLANLSTTPLSLNKFPNIIIDIKGEAAGTKTLTIINVAKGKIIFVLLDIFLEA